MSTSDRPVWQRQPGETNAAYQAFECYRDMGGARTVLGAYKQYAKLRGLQSQRVSSSFHGWKREHNWDQRVRAFDNDVTVVKVERQVEAIQEANEVLYASARGVAITLVRIATGTLKDAEGNPSDASSAQVQACRDVLDRVGVTRKRAEAAQTVQGDQNNQYNFDLSGADVQDLLALVDVLS